MTCGCSNLDAQLADMAAENRKLRAQLAEIRHAANDAPSMILRQRILAILDRQERTDAM
jgi:hypothetical protein